MCIQYVLQDRQPSMEVAVIQRQYDEVISSQYDRDPQNVTGQSLDRALNHLESTGMFSGILPPMRVLDVGMGTGMFLEKLRHRSCRLIEPFGIDLSQRMAAIASQKLPDLHFAIDDGANLDAHFQEEQFHLAATHFVTGFVSLSHLAPRICAKLTAGGIWSFVGGTKAAYGSLQRKASHPLLKLLFGARSLDLSGMICPQDEQEVAGIMQENGFEVLMTETFQPALRFADFQSFLEYAYHGGWLTPFVEEIGLHKAGKWQQAILNRLIFPVLDHHNIVLAVARRRD